MSDTDPSTSQEVRLEIASEKRRFRVGLIVGDQETLHCGVKDHAHRLKEALEQIGFDVTVIAPASWSLLEMPSFVRHLRSAKYDILHVQYPSIGFRTSLVPHVLGLLRIATSTVVTLHEYTLLPLAQRASLHAFRWTANGIFFGSSFERASFNRSLRSRGAEQDVFPILSQVPSALPSTRRDLTVAYFGQIRPNKGLEEFLELARLSKEEQKTFEFLIMGSVNRANRSYAEELLLRADQDVRWLFDLPFEEVARTLARSFAAYLPFPDGASERRGSMPAAWLNGLPVLSTVGKATTDAIRERIVVVSSPSEALVALEGLLTQPAKWERFSEISCAYASDHSWDAVAQRHAAMYARVSGTPE